MGKVMVSCISKGTFPWRVMVKSSNCEVFAIYFMSCVGQRKIFCGDTARLCWIPCEFCRELEKLDQRCCSEGKAKARNALPLCPVSAQWEMLSPNKWLEATAPQMPKLHIPGRDYQSAVGKKNMHLRWFTTQFSTEKTGGTRFPQVALCPPEFLSSSEDVVHHALGFLFYIHSSTRGILWCLDL